MRLSDSSTLHANFGQNRACKTLASQFFMTHQHVRYWNMLETATYGRKSSESGSSTNSCGSC